MADGNIVKEAMSDLMETLELKPSQVLGIDTIVNAGPVDRLPEGLLRIARSEVNTTWSLLRVVMADRQMDVADRLLRQCVDRLVLVQQLAGHNGVVNTYELSTANNKLMILLTNLEFIKEVKTAGLTKPPSSR